MVSGLASSAVDRGIEPRSDQIKDNKISICCFSSKHSALAVRPQTGWLSIRIMSSSGVTCLPTDCCFSELQYM